MSGRSLSAQRSTWLLRRVGVSAVAGLLLGLPVALLGPGDFLRGWLAASLLLAISVFSLVSAWRWGGGGKALGILMTAAFCLRLLTGIGLSLALPIYGYDEEVQKAGYLFPDAYERDREAFDLAVSGERLLFNPTLSLASDQYGGLGLTSAAVYRYLSPDAHRPFLILILGSLFFALGVPFLWRAAGLRLTPRAALIAAWVYVFYPDGLFFTSSQMREPFMLGLSALALWAVLAWRTRARMRERGGLAALAFSLAGMLFFSTRSALFIIGVLAILFWLDFSASRSGRVWKWLGWGGLAVGALAGLALTWEWFRWASVWDQVLTLRNSGMATTVLDRVGDRFRIPFLLIYGLVQPVLPAAISEPGIPLWKTIVILRSLGWYLAVPLLAYAGFSAWKEVDPSRRRLVLWAVLSTAAWACVASLRAGGDMTDNPRYRMLFLVIIALALGWAVDWARSRRDPWLVRWLLIEAVFLGFFTHWYFSRYFSLGVKLDIFLMMGLIVGISVLILAGGFIWDLLQRRRRPG
jgi:hypothetical protein